jgi:hypothetical protein
LAAFHARSTGGLSNRNEKRLWSVDASLTMISQDDLKDSNRFDVTGAKKRFLQNRRFWQGLRCDDLGRLLVLASEAWPPRRP